jgi:hypothetical protein
MTESDVSRVLREAGEQFLVGDAPLLIDELTAALLVVSARAARVRQHVGVKEPVLGEMRSLDEAFSRAVSLARKLSAAIRAHRDSGSYVAAATVVRELGNLLSTSLPNREVCSMRLSADRAIVPMPAAELRRVLVTVLRIAGDSVGLGGPLLLQVETEHATETQPSVVRIALGHEALNQATATRAANEVRPVVNARGGSVEARTTGGGAAAIVVSLPGAC